MKNLPSELISVFVSAALIFVMPLTTLAGEKPSAAQVVNTKSPSPATAANTIISFKVWTQLARARQEIYLIGLQKLIEELDHRDALEHVEYQSAARESFLLHWILPTASAVDSGRRCVYAGWVSEMDINGRYCLAPRAGSCGQGQIECNPLLYGEGKCSKSGRSATSHCTASAKSPAEIAQEIRAKGKAGSEAWATLQSEIGGYCASPRPTQKTVCAMIRSRVLALRRIIGKISDDSLASPPVAVAVAAEEPVAPLTSNPAAQKSIKSLKPSLGKAKATPIVVVTVPSEHKFESTKTADTLPLAPVGSCNQASLLGNLKYSGEAAAGWNFLDIEDAQTLMCQRDPIPPDWYKIHRDRAEAKVRNAPTGDKWQRENKSSLKQLFNNFDICYREAVRLRQAKAPETLGLDATLTYLQNGFVDLRTPSKVISAGNGSWDLESMILAEGLSLCNIRTIDPTGIRRTGAQKGLAPSHSSTSAQ